MPILPAPNTFQRSVRFVVPGFGWVTLSWLASSFMNSSASTFSGFVIVHVSPSTQSPPLPHMNSENSACASSGPSGMP